jgi:hypothetical protein
MLKKFVCAAATFALAACSGPTLHVTSDTAWSGTVNGNGRSDTVAGSGDKTFELRRGTTCWTFNKTTAQGTLRAYARGNGSPLNGDDRTADPFGSVNGCV